MAVKTDIHKILIEKSKRGKRGAQRELYGLYSKAMFNVCFRMMNEREDAEDMLQESFGEAFNKLSSFKYESTFGAWLKRIVVNKCINELKRKKSLIHYKDDMEVYENRSDEGNDDSQAEMALSVEKIKKAMIQLPEGGRIIFSLYMLEGYDHTEIGEILGIEKSASRSQLARAKKRMLQIINEENVLTE